MSDEQGHDDLLDLTAAERFFRHVADDARADAAAGRWVSDTAEAYRLVVDELDRLRARLHLLEGEGPHRPVTCGDVVAVRGDLDPELPRRAGFDPPPFAPELADAPLPTGESGSPAPLVVDQPVHDSTLPAELEEGGR